MKLEMISRPKGTYVTVENKAEGAHFYIIRKGRVRVFSSITSETSSLNRNLSAGDFFGVISCMTERPRLQSSYVLEDCELLVVKKHQFGFLIEKSAPLALRILRSFSNDLRKYDEELVQKTTMTEKKIDEVKSFLDLGIYYYNKESFYNAAYIFIQFLKNFPNETLSKTAIEYLQKIDQKYIDPQEFSSSISRTYQDKRMLFCDGERGYEMFILEEGQVKINKIIDGKEVLIAVLNPGDIFGEMALLNNKSRTASAEAFGEARCTVFNSNNFDNIFRENTALGMRIVTLLSERIWTIYKQLDNLFFSDYGARIYDILLTHLLKEKVPIESHRKYSFSFGQEEVFKMIGIEQEKVALAFNKILDGNVIFVDQGRLHCRDVTALQKEVDFARKMEQRSRNIKSSKGQGV